MPAANLENLPLKTGGRTIDTDHTPRNRARPAPPGGYSRALEAEEGWVWGLHAGRAAALNPARDIKEILATRNAARELPGDARGLRVVEPKEIDAVLPASAVHQGLAVRCAPLEPVALEDLAAPAAGLLVVLDQVTDPQNVGAIIRSAVAFGARGLVLQDRKSPPLMGGCAKAAAGAAEKLAHARVVNIARALGELVEAGWSVVGLAGEARTSLEEALLRAERGVALVLGAEGKGLRPGVAEACAELAAIPIAAEAESLNVSNAAAVALYEARRRLQGGAP